MKSILFPVLVVTAALSPGCSKQSPQAASQPAQVPASAAPPAATTPAASITGDYAGELEGASATATISGSPPSYSIHIIMGANGCGGGAQGPALADSAGVLTLKPADDATCTITLTPTGPGYSVKEDQCQNLHGDLCAFNGELHRAH